MILCQRCSFQNDERATVCAGPGCAARLLKQEPICRIHRLPVGAAVCHICAAQSSKGPAARYIGGATHGFTPAAKNPQRRKTLDVRKALPTAFAPPETPATRMNTIDERLQRAEGGRPGPLYPQNPEASRLQTSGESPRRIVPETVNRMAAQRRHTFNLHNEDAAKPETPNAASEPVAGLLVTYSWDPAGRIYPLRAGLNRIGASPECEVSVPEDDALSSMHASIRFRRKFLINDLDSENGTEVNDTSVDEVYLRLANYARIKTGNTVWTFIIINLPLDADQAELS